MNLPNTFKKLMVQRLTTDFRKAVELVSRPMVEPGADEVIVKNMFAGVNATDINISAGRYGQAPPFGVGIEAIGEIVSVGTNVKHLKVKDALGHIGCDGFSEYSIVSATRAFPIPEIKPEYISLFVSGLTAAIAMDKVAEIKKGDTVLVTAAAGALGQIAVQWCKLAGCHVIGMCSTAEKEKILKDLGCDDIFNYKEDNLSSFLKKNYPNGIDVVWETIGGEVYQTLVENLAIKGRLVVIGAITGYKDESKIATVDVKGLAVQMLSKSSSVRGFLLSHFVKDFPEYFGKLVTLYKNGSLKLNIDDGSKTISKPFEGMEGCIEGVEYLHTGKSSGKVVIQIQ